MTFRKTLLASVLIAAATPAFAEMQVTAPNLPGTSDQQAACRPDVRKFCRSVKSDGSATAYLACLQENRSKLSRACSAVLSAHGR
jgi:hypothetical protein